MWLWAFPLFLCWLTFLLVITNLYCSEEPPMHYCYKDDTFAIFDSENDCDEFLHQLNLHPSLLFTFEKEGKQFLPFLDVQVEKVVSKLIYICLP